MNTQDDVRACHRRGAIGNGRAHGGIIRVGNRGGQARARFDGDISAQRLELLDRLRRTGNAALTLGEFLDNSDLHRNPPGGSKLAGDQQDDDRGNDHACDGAPLHEGHEPRVGLGRALHISF